MRARENRWRVIPHGRRLCPWFRSQLCVELARDPQCERRLPLLHRPLRKLSLSEVVLQGKDWLFILPSIQRSQQLHLVAKERTDHVEGNTHWLETMSCLPRRSIARDSQRMGANPSTEGPWRRARCGGKSSRRGSRDQGLTLAWTLCDLDQVPSLFWAA